MRAEYTITICALSNRPRGLKLLFTLRFSHQCTVHCHTLSAEMADVLLLKKYPPSLTAYILSLSVSLPFLGKETRLRTCPLYRYVLVSVRLSWQDLEHLTDFQ